VGWVIVPITGAEGDANGVFITTLPDAAETQPEASVTVKV
jgi:hypothetical protein